MLVLLSEAAVESSYWDEFGEHCMQAPWSLDSSSSDCRCLSGSPSEIRFSDCMPIAQNAFFFTPCTHWALFLVELIWLSG